MTPFVADQLIAAAMARTGMDDFGGDDFVEPLEVMCAALDREADLTDLARSATQRYLERLLDVRLQLVDYFTEDPEVAREVVVAPIFIVGPPRSGTTVMHRLVATNPAVRVPEGWEFLRPLPPPGLASYDSDPRIQEVAEELSFPQRAAPGLRAIHTYSARMPKECLSAMSFSFRTEEFVSRYRVPSYVEWLQACDMTPAYEMHRRVLQVLQREMPADPWVLKSPVHLQSLPELTSVYPDARLVLTHRDPAPVLASVSSLIATLRSAFSSSVDPAEIGEYHLRLYGRSLDGLVDAVDGVLASHRVVSVRHTDVVRDPMGELDAVYNGLGLEFSPALRSLAQAELESSREDRLGAHTYDANEYGIDAMAVDAAFSRYRARFVDSPR